MNNKLTYYKVQWLERDIVWFWNSKEKRYYFEKEALDFKALVDKSDNAKNCVVKKITEITEVIS